MILEDPLIYAVKLANPTLDPASLTKSFFIFGEHPRELITAETGLLLLLQLCGEEPSSIDISAILQTNQFIMVLNSNPYGRAKVENGHYCQRTNEGGVDINRNWDDHWEPVTIKLNDLVLKNIDSIMKAQINIQVHQHLVNQRHEP